MASQGQESQEQATFAGGCFWCLEPPFAQLEGVTNVQVGYMGGSITNPSYEQVSTGSTGHYEVLQVSFLPDVLSYEQLLETFWRQVDPTDEAGQFSDRGTQYQTAIFYHSSDQKKAAEASKKKMSESGIFPKPIVTSILPASLFYSAEEHHQQYYKKNPDHYQAYSWGSGRKAFLSKTWQSSA